MFSLEYELELRRRSAINFAKLLDCLERIINKEVSHIYDWPTLCESYYLDVCASSATSQYSSACKNQLTTPAAVRRICNKYFTECLKEAYGE